MSPYCAKAVFLGSASCPVGTFLRSSPAPVHVFPTLRLQTAPPCHPLTTYHGPLSSAGKSSAPLGSLTDQLEPAWSLPLGCCTSSHLIWEVSLCHLHTQMPAYRYCSSRWKCKARPHFRTEGRAPRAPSTIALSICVLQCHLHTKPEAPACQAPAKEGGWMRSAHAPCTEGAGGCSETPLPLSALSAGGITFHLACNVLLATTVCECCTRS